jgi:transposase-like protein
MINSIVQFIFISRRAKDVRHLYMNGISVNEIARTLRINKFEVLKILKRHR